MDVVEMSSADLMRRSRQLRQALRRAVGCAREDALGELRQIDDEMASRFASDDWKAAWRHPATTGFDGL